MIDVFSSKAPYDRVLIVCEGKKTEVNYFQEIVNHYRLPTTDVVIKGFGTDPVSLVDTAEELYKKSKKEKSSSYDHIYCVFDQDDFESNGGKFSQAKDKISRNKTKGAKFHAITSIPCFEIWLILHFEVCTRPFCKTENNTAAKEAERYLKKAAPPWLHQRRYENLFNQLLSTLTKQ